MISVDREFTKGWKHGKNDVLLSFFQSDYRTIALL